MEINRLKWVISGKRREALTLKQKIVISQYKAYLRKLDRNILIRWKVKWMIETDKVIKMATRIIMVETKKETNMSAIYT